MKTSSAPAALIAACVLGLLAQTAAADIPGVKMPPANDGKLRIIAFGAHPDDCEIRVGGAGMLWAQKGHHVLFVSVTNGDIGHWREAGGQLAQRRKKEVDAAHEIYGVQGVILDIHDGELEPTLENRRKITRLIREWNADLVLGPRTNDYHPDHRYTGVLVQDAAYMVAVPFFCPDVPPLKKNPVFMLYEDRFQKPSPSKGDMVVGIDAVIDRKLDGLVGMISQFAEGGALGHAGLYPDDPAGQQRRKKEVRDNFARRFSAIANRFRKELGAWYPADKAQNIKYAEAYEIGEYGAQPSKDELKRLFPFFD